MYPEISIQSNLRLLSICGLAVLQLSLGSGCTTQPVASKPCLQAGEHQAHCAPVGAIQDVEIERLYQQRSYDYLHDLDVDPIEFAKTADIPISQAQVKFAGSTDSGALSAIAAKLWMIENAEHTLDVIYYILREDLAGFSLLGALCDAVERGVDVRLMIDSIGASDLGREHLRALNSCAVDAGFIHNREGQVTVNRARAQAAVFNAATKAFSRLNRRSHDKVIIKDGAFNEKAYIITGGRNMSLDYYGFLENGEPNPHSYRDAEIIVRGVTGDSESGIGTVASAFYSSLFAFDKNRKYQAKAAPKYQRWREHYRDSLAKIKSLPRVQEHYRQMDSYMNNGFANAQVRFAHNLQNIGNKHLVTKAVENLSASPNSIIGLLGQLRGQKSQRVQIVSPYLFAAYYKEDGEVIVDEAAQILEWLEANPDSTIEIVTNSVLTGDNIFTQSVIDLDMAPRLLLSPEVRDQWAEGLAKGEENTELVQSEAWVEMVNHPRLHIYETGKMDDVSFGGSYHHSKLHAKYIIGDNIGFVGTTNFDYRSRLFNSESGFFFDSEKMAQSIADNTEYLISLSYRWGTPEWLEMRRAYRKTRGLKAFAARHQRGIYKTIKTTGLIWLF